MPCEVLSDYYLYIEIELYVLHNYLNYDRSLNIVARPVNFKL